MWYALFRADGSTVDSATSLNGVSKQGIIDNKGFLQLHSDGKVSAAKSSVQLLTRADGGMQAKAGRRLRRGHKAKGRALCTCGGGAFSRCVRMKSARWVGREQRGRSCCSALAARAAPTAAWRVRLQHGRAGTRTAA